MCITNLFKRYKKLGRKKNSFDTYPWLKNNYIIYRTCVRNVLHHNNTVDIASR